MASSSRAKSSTKNFVTLRLGAQEILFDADAIQQSSLRRNAEVRSGWFWLPRNGLDQLVKIALQRGFWREREGLIAKKWERCTKVIARLNDFGPNPIDTGRFLINVTPVYVSEGEPPDSATSTMCSRKTSPRWSDGGPGKTQ
jgi:hypothetical protein